MRLLTRQDFETDQEWLECCAAREAWLRRTEPRPSNPNETWEDWYPTKFGRPLAIAVAQYRALADRDVRRTASGS